MVEGWSQGADMSSGEPVNPGSIPGVASSKISGLACAEKHDRQVGMQMSEQGSDPPTHETLASRNRPLHRPRRAGFDARRSR